VAIVNVPARDSALADLRALWAQRGWRALPSPGYRISGLVISPAATAGRPYVTLCEEHQVLAAILQQERGDVATISIQITEPSAGPNPCAPTPVQARRSGDPRIVIDTRMVNPSACGRFPRTSGVMVRSVLATMAPRELLTAFGRELADSGWAEVGDQEVQSQNWTRMDSAGSTHDAAITVARLAGPISALCREVTLLWHDLQPRRALLNLPGLAVLTLPSGVDEYGIGPCAAPAASETQEIESSQAPAQLVAQYGRQLADSGWTRSAEQNTVVGRTWRKPESGGARREISIQVAASSWEPVCRGVFIRQKEVRP